MKRAECAALLDCMAEAQRLVAEDPGRDVQGATLTLIEDRGLRVRRGRRGRVQHEALVEMFARVDDTPIAGMSARDRLNLLAAMERSAGTG